MNTFILVVFSVLFAISCQTSEEARSFKINFDKVPFSAQFVSDSMSIWGGSLVKGEDGLYHMFYSRWPKNLGWAWVTHSEIAHAVSDSPLGPFEFKDVSLPVREDEYWDGLCTHNPTIHKFDGKYYLYYMGNTGDGVVVGIHGKPDLNWVHRNNQRIGVAIAENPFGPWQRFEKPVLDITHNDSLAHDALMTSNPSICQRPNGSYLMVYKAVGKKFPAPFGGPVVHMIATSDNPAGPFIKHPNPIFTFEGERFPAEDPYIWHQEGKYRAIVKRMKHSEKKQIFSLELYESIDGFDWSPAPNPKISDLEFEWENGKLQKLNHLERPQLYFENGLPKVLLCAADTLDQNGVRQSFNVQIPLK